MNHNRFHRLNKFLDRLLGKRRSGAPVRVMDRQFPSAEGTGPTVRRATGRRSGPRLSALRYPLFEVAKGSKPTIWTETRRDAPRGNAPARLSNCMEIR